jgi:hypothetical protein
LDVRSWSWWEQQSAYPEVAYLRVLARSDDYLSYGFCDVDGAVRNHSDRSGSKSWRRGGSGGVGDDPPLGFLLEGLAFDGGQFREDELIRLRPSVDSDGRASSHLPSLAGRELLYHPFDHVLHGRISVLDRKQSEAGAVFTDSFLELRGVEPDGVSTGIGVAAPLAEEIAVFAEAGDVHGLQDRSTCWLDG